MDRSEMICRSCVKFDGFVCRLWPDPVAVADPDHHWCSQGRWHVWSQRYREMEPYFWGEWRESVH